MTHLPITFGILAIAVAIASCSGIALLIASGLYFIMLSNAFKDYLEEWLWQKATGLFRRKRTSASAAQPTTNSANADNLAASNVGLLNQAAEPNDANNTHNEHDIRETDKVAKETEEAMEACTGLQNFPFHITMLLLIALLTALNGPGLMAWVLSKKDELHLPDPALVPSIIVIGCLSILLQLKAPNKIYGYKILSIILYLSASVCVLYCQEAVYRLNYVIAFIFGLITLQEIICGIWIICFRNS